MDQIVKTLNAGQEAAAEGFFKFLFSDDKEMILSGPGGVGKTFLMGHMIDEILPRYYETCELMGIDPEYDDVQMTATTNKAAEVLSLSTGRPTDTVHAFMNLKVTDDFDTGTSKLSRTTAWQVYHRKIIFVDESSMIDTGLREEILGGTIKCKIVYVGDHCQMAPIKEPISPIYNARLPFFELTEPMRNAGQPALQKLCLQYRKAVEEGVFPDIQLTPGVVDHLSDEEMQAEIDTVFLDTKPDARILAYQNSRVIDYNTYIRQIRQLPPRFQKGEFLINNSAIKLKKTMLKVEDEVEIYDISSHSEMVEIETNVELEVMHCTLRTKLGDMLYNVPIPVDHDHYRNLIKYYKRQKRWNRFFFLKNNFPDLRERDASTVYKAQGSTCKTVYIDLTDISKCHNPNQVARMLYVAVSRATTRVAFYGQLALKYGSIVF
jgi:ATP-dependent exoDNAse (exonuclease V) alpha subunit